MASPYDTAPKIDLLGYQPPAPILKLQLSFSELLFNIWWLITLLMSAAIISFLYFVIFKNRQFRASLKTPESYNDFGTIWVGYLTIIGGTWMLPVWMIQGFRFDLLLLGFVLLSASCVAGLACFLASETESAGQQQGNSKSYFEDVGEEEGDFGYQDSASSGGGSSAGNKQADDSQPGYQTMFQQAQEKASQFSDARAEYFAGIFQTKADKQTNRTTKQHLELVAMLLRERAKGYKGTPDKSAATKEEKRLLLLVAS